ncbi:DUF1499 domain-containing protein [Gammaproteobacteria bacterium AH-315-E17]|nr:DUF1499 domain-containing protein [Gammaproteobacteria bacterium AH-315-E17]
MNDTTSSKTYIDWIAIAVLTVGLIIGLIFLAAPAGTSLGLWVFGTGLQILITLDPYTHWIAIVCAVGLLAVVIMAIRSKAENTVKLCTFAAIGTLSAFLSWYIPSTVQARLVYPVIHDISTDVNNPPVYVANAPLRIEAANPMEYGTVEGLSPEEHAQAQLEAFPDLVPQLIDASPQEVFDRALAALETMGLEITAAVPEEGRIEAVATTFWFRFKDDVVIRIQAEGNQTRIDARSLSRVGRGDLGANGLRLQEFFSLL